MKRLIDRRAALGALASVPALALPAAVMSVNAATAGGPSAHLDAALFALIAVARDLGARCNSASDAYEAAFNRTDELVTTLDQFWAAHRLAQERSGEIDAEKRLDELLAEKRELWQRITTTPAQTLAGMMAKLAVAAPYFEADELADREGSADSILVSIAVDFNTLHPACQAKELANV